MFAFFHCIVFARVFVLVFFSLPGVAAFNLWYFNLNRTSHLRTYSITILVISTYHSSDFTALQYTFLFRA